MTVKIVQADTGSGKSVWPAATPRYVNSLDPRMSEINHDEWRAHQLETLDWIVDEPGSVIVLTQSKALQTQYGFYNAAVLFGRNNYTCAHPDVHGTCADCVHHLAMYKCDYARQCEYLIQKEIAKASAFTALNRAYWLTAAWPKNDGRRYVYLDEAHGLAEATLAWAGCTVTDKQRSDWQLPPFPMIEHRHANTILRLPEPYKAALAWLKAARNVMAKHFIKWELLGKLPSSDDKTRDMLRQCENLGRKLTATREAIETNSDEWYIRSGNNGLLHRRTPQPGFLCRPLTARHHFPSYFLNGHNTIAMSATIGNKADFAKELGIIDYEGLDVPSRFAPHERQVHLLDVPNMSSRATDADFEHQADAIAAFIRQYPPGWSGLIHVSRKTEEKYLHDRLCRRGLAARVWYMPGKIENYIPTDKQLEAWLRRKKRVENSLLVTCSFGEGYDGLDERICIIAKVGFRRWGSELSYDRAWATWSKARYDHDAAIKTMQEAGRTRRGRDGDYDIDGINGAVAIADGSISRIKSKLSVSFVESLV